MRPTVALVPWRSCSMMMQGVLAHPFWLRSAAVSAALQLYICGSMDALPIDPLKVMRLVSHLRCHGSAHIRSVLQLHCVALHVNCPDSSSGAAVAALMLAPVLDFPPLCVLHTQLHAEVQSATTFTPCRPYKVAPWRLASNWAAAPFHASHPSMQALACTLAACSAVFRAGASAWSVHTSTNCRMVASQQLCAGIFCCATFLYCNTVAQPFRVACYLITPRNLAVGCGGET